MKGYIKSLLKLNVCICIFLTFGCDSKNNNDDMESRRVEFLLILQETGANNYQAHCLQSQTSALACANDASLGSVYVTAITAAYLLTVASPQGSSEICDAINNSQSLSTFSIGARSCLFQCQNTYWTHVTNSGNCTFANYPQQLSDSAQTINTCFLDCMQSPTQFVF